MSQEDATAVSNAEHRLEVVQDVDHDKVATPTSRAKAVVALANEMSGIVDSAKKRCEFIEEGRKYVEQVQSDMAERVSKTNEQLTAIAESHDRVTHIRTQVQTDAEALSRNATQAGEHAKVIARGAVLAVEAEEQCRASKLLVDAAGENCSAIEQRNRESSSMISDLNSKVTNATEAVQKIEVQATRSNELLGTITAVGTNIAQTKSQVETDAARTKALAEISDALELRVTGYEKQAAEYSTHFKELANQIESLLPGATSTGLAEAFRVRKEQFQWPHRGWTAVFIGCIVLLILLYVFGFGKLVDIKAASSVSHLGFGLLQRLPFTVLLVWLAIHSARQATIFKRLEEEYAFKEVVSRSFEGYKREMLKIDPNLSPQSVAHQLCSHFLQIISLQPGRLYESKYRDPTPFTAFKEVISPAVAAMRNIKGP